MRTSPEDRQLPTWFDPDRWIPPPNAASVYRISGFMRSQGIANYQELYARAAQEPEWFYPAAHKYIGMEWMREWVQLIDESEGTPFANWFVGGGTNVAWLATRRFSPSSIPIVWEGDDGATRTLTGGELNDLVGRAAAGLRALGVAQGDVVTMHLPMIPEAVITLLACARIGALSAPAFSGYAVDALAERIELSGAKVVITSDGMLRRGREFEMLPVAEEACRRATVPPTIVVVPRLGTTRLPADAVSWDSLLSNGLDGAPEIFDASTPCLLAFTSGSTGRPKGVVHTHGGMPYEAPIEFAFEMDVREGDRMCWPSDMGWLTGPTSTLTPLILGATTFLYEGVADFPAPDRLWKMVERHAITHLGIPPTVGRLLEHAGSEWVVPYDLDTLRVITSTGEPWTHNAWRWIHKNVGRGRAPIINWAGGTEVGGGLLAGNPIVPTSACQFSGPALGKLPDAVDESGNSVSEQLGELVVRRSWPSMTRGFFKERERYLQSHWERFSGLWVQGDRVIHHSDGTWELPGRSDDVIKVAGKRVGPTEYEAVATDVYGVVGAAAVGLSHPIKGEVPVIAVTVDPDQVQDRDIPGEVIARAEGALGKAMKPYAVVVVPKLPLTRSGKIHRRVLRSWLTDTDPGDVSSLDSLEGEDDIRKVGFTIPGLKDA